MLTRADVLDIIMERLALPPPGGPLPLGRGGGPPERATLASEAPDEVRTPPPLGRIKYGGAATALPRPGRLFLSEYDVKMRLTPQSQQLKIPGDAILSPLAADWLVLKGIKIIKE